MLDRIFEPDVPVSDKEGSWQRACRQVAARHGLTPRETEVLVLIAKGRNTAYISTSLSVSHHTAKTHVYRIYKKLGVDSQQSVINMVEDQQRSRPGVRA